jgi:tripartite-type tricarboxylate transporter receptor subunit TctC
MQERLGQAIVVDNRPGANGGLAAGVLSQSGADGHTLMVTDGSIMSSNPLLYSKLTYDPEKDFVPVALLARAPLFLAVHPSVPVNSLRDFIEYARARPGQVNYGSSGIGSTHHLSMEAIKSAFGPAVTHVPCRGSGQSVPALVGGQVEVLFSAYPSLAGFVRDGRVKLIATNGAERSAQAPDVPPVADLIPGFDFAPIVGILAPAGTPDAVVRRLAADAIAALKVPEASRQLSAGGIEPVGLGPEGYARAIKAENERYADVVKAAGIKPE